MIVWAKVGGILVAVLIVFFAGYHVGGLAPKLAAAKTEVKQEAAQAAADTKQLTVNTQAEAAHDQAVEHPPALIISHPVWLHEPQVCPSVPVPTAAAGGNPSGGAADAGPSVDLRPQLAAFALKYEAALADCRRMAAEWPAP